MSRRAAPRLIAFVVTSWVLFGHASLTAAQSERPPVRMPRVEVGAGIGWVGQYDVGTRDATMITNALNDPPPFIFFKVKGRTRSGAVASGWLGVNVTSAVGVEVVGHYSRPSLRATLTADVERAPDTTLVASSFSEVVVEANLLYHFNRGRFDEEHTVPFMLIGGGHLEQREEGVVESGSIYQAGIGFKWNSTIDRTRRARGLGLRLDLRYVLRDGGFDFGSDRLRSFVAGSATTTFGF